MNQKCDTLVAIKHLNEISDEKLQAKGMCDFSRCVYVNRVKKNLLDW